MSMPSLWPYCFGQVSSVKINSMAKALGAPSQHWALLSQVLYTEHNMALAILNQQICQRESMSSAYGLSISGD